MSLLENLRARRGAVHKKKRLGRGDSSGKGGTSGKGHKGQKARKSGGIRRGFEGGQSPIILRMPKFGFTRNWAGPGFQIVNLEQVVRWQKKHAAQKLSKLGPEELKRMGLLKKLKQPVKLLGSADLGAALEFKVHKASKAAQDCVQKAGGKVQYL